MSPVRACISLLLAAAPVASISAPSAEGTAASAARSGPHDTLVLRYDLRPGDHLIYRQVLEEEMDNRRPYGLDDPPPRPFGRAQLQRARGEWRVHLLVLEADGAGGARVAWIRRRSSAEALESVVEGEEDPEAGRTRVRSWLAPADDSVRVHSHRVSDRGVWLTPPDLVREWPSKILWAITELPLLPPEPVSPGRSWPGEAGFGFTYEIVRTGSAGSGECVEAEGTAGPGSLLSRSAALDDRVETRWRFCPDRGLVDRLEVTAPYPGASFQRFEQRISLELLERRRGESVEAWLLDPEVRAGALRGLNAAGPVMDIPEEAVHRALHRALRSGDPVTLREALTLLLRHDLAPPSPEVTGILEAHEDPEIARLAGILAARRTPSTTAGNPSEAALGCLARLDDPSSVVALDPLPPEPPGTALRVMVSDGHVGWPFALHVPPEYTGDEPFPLLIYLSGNAGTFLEGILIGHPAFSPSPYLVLYPHAHASWWSAESRRMMDALISEVLARYRVDTDRIYLSGLSNGGTGAFYYAALWPHRFTAVVPAMGAGLFAAWESPRDFPAVGNLAHLPTLFLHGESDPVIGVGSTLRTVAAMEERGVTPEVVTFPGRGHGITPDRGDDGLTLDFFERHRRRTVPRAIEFEVSRPAYARHYWAQIMEIPDTAAVARVRAEAREDGRFVLHTENVGRLRLLLPPDLLPPGDAVIEVNGEELFRGAVAPSCEIMEASLEATRDPHLAYPLGLEIRVPGT